MDRDQRWDRIERAYNLLQRGEAPFHAIDGAEALANAYARDEGDEFVQPTAIHGPDDLPRRIEDGDAVVFMNFRADRARQLTRAFVDEDFDGFERRSHAHQKRATVGCQSKAGEGLRTRVSCAGGIAEPRARLPFG